MFARSAFTNECRRTAKEEKEETVREKSTEPSVEVKGNLDSDSEYYEEEIVSLPFVCDGTVIEQIGSASIPSEGKTEASVNVNYVHSTVEVLEPNSYVYFLCFLQ